MRLVSFNQRVFEITLRNGQKILVSPKRSKVKDERGGKLRHLFAHLGHLWGVI